jgi:uncharacterized protein (TIGR03067 family)
MRLKALVGLMIAGLLLAADAKDDAAKEMKKLEGTWKVVAAEASGTKVPDDKLKDAVVIIKGDKLTLGDKGDKGAKDLVFKIDPSKKPKQIDLTDPKDKDKTALGIYSLEGDELKLCIPLSPPGKKDEKTRPDSFETKDKKALIFTCKREKS